MATTLLNFSTAAQEIPAQADKIIQIRRLVVGTAAEVIGTPRITIKNDAGNHIAPPLPVGATPADVAFPDECPQGNRGEAVSITASTSLSSAYLWVEWRYVD